MKNREWRESGVGINSLRVLKPHLLKNTVSNI